VAGVLVLRQGGRLSLTEYAIALLAIPLAIIAVHALVLAIFGYTLEPADRIPKWDE